MPKVKLIVHCSFCNCFIPNNYRDSLHAHLISEHLDAYIDQVCKQGTIPNFCQGCGINLYAYTARDYHVHIRECFPSQNDIDSSAYRLKHMLLSEPSANGPNAKSSD